MTTPRLPNHVNPKLPTGSWRDKLKVLAPHMDRRTASVSAAVFLTAMGDLPGADSIYREILERRPNDLAALRGMAQVLRFTGRSGEAVEMRIRALTVEATNLGLAGPERDEATAFLLAAEGGASIPAMAPAGYITKSFDLYDSFDDVLVDKLKYRAPQELRTMVDETRPARSRSLRVLDLGCGTGLSGAAFRDIASHLHGVDLSPRMLERARAKQIYDTLEENDIIAAMQTAPAGYDLIIATDVFLYIGDLTACLGTAAQALAPGGALCFSVEILDGDGFILQGTRRFAHGRSHVEAAVQAAGLTFQAKESVLRLENSTPVGGLLVVASR